VTDAPAITQPVFVAFHIRKRHDSILRKALTVLSSVAAEIGSGETPQQLGDGLSREERRAPF
jgi:hypothetical protein